MMDEQLKEIALRVIGDMPPIERRSVGNYCLEFATRFLAALPVTSSNDVKPEPFAYLFEDEGGERYWYPSSNPQPLGIKVYTEAPPIQSAQGWQPEDIDSALQDFARLCAFSDDVDARRNAANKIRSMFYSGAPAQPDAAVDDVRDAERWRAICKEADIDYVEISIGKEPYWVRLECTEAMEEFADAAIAAAKGEK